MCAVPLVLSLELSGERHYGHELRYDRYCELKEHWLCVDLENTCSSRIAIGKILA